MLSAFLLFNVKNWNLFSPEYQSPICQVRREKSQNVHCFWRWRAVGAWEQWGKTRVLIIESLPLAEPHAKSTRIVTSFSRPKIKIKKKKSLSENLKLMHWVSKHWLHIMLHVATLGAGKVGKLRDEREVEGQVLRSGVVEPKENQRRDPYPDCGAGG